MCSHPCPQIAWEAPAEKKADCIQKGKNNQVSHSWLFSVLCSHIQVLLTPLFITCFYIWGPYLVLLWVLLSQCTISLGSVQWTACTRDGI